MYKITIISILLLLSTLISCDQQQMKTPSNFEHMFENFISKEKFKKDNTIFYPGISDEKLKPIVTDLINQSAKDFQNIAKKGNATEQEYQNAIETGLKRFSKIYLELDTEDKERICSYYEELMDIVQLESSAGHLNNFIYGFNPSK
ncbi:DUF4844 domain-containing protein [Chishuiella sp.]|uniref:DUF4844 domain-containing protein n=1 Tax=Chishuiella sp. TaxID=1969467 RepID=UPI0028A67A89|nr:DUF4844 domain-containing protein [Chishuiella sp.]